MIPSRIPGVAAAALLAFLYALPASATAIFNFHLSPVTGTATDGTIEFANVGDALPSAWSVQVGGITYDQTDIVFGSPTPNVTWAASVPQSISLAIFNITPASTLTFVSTGTYGTSPLSGSGTYSFSAVPEPGTGMSLAMGMAFLALRRRVTRLVALIEPVITRSSRTRKRGLELPTLRGANQLT